MALVKADETLQVQNNLIDSVLAQLEKSIHHLEQSLDSLDEVVLQNRRGLDLFFLEQEWGWGFCHVIGELCCFCTNSGIIRNSLAMVSQRLVKRAKLRQQNQNWYESLFSWSPYTNMGMSGTNSALVNCSHLWTLCGKCSRQIHMRTNLYSTIDDS